MDNFGGINKVWLTYASFIESMNENKLTASPSLKSGKSWLGIIPGQYGSTIKIEPQTSESGTVYNVSVTIKIPFQNIDNDEYWYMMQLTGHGVAMKYQTLSGDIFIVGSKKFPLKSVFEELHPSSPSTGYNGWQLTLSGKQLTPQLLVVD